MRARSVAPGRALPAERLNPQPFDAGEQLPKQCHQFLAFYFPGRSASCDELCHADFLGNFYPADVTLEKAFKKCTFTNAEAAYQAGKFWDRAEEFQYLTAEQAFSKSRQLPWDGHSLARAGDKLKAMKEVIAQKFRPGSHLASRLKETKDSFLLEHNSVTGRDAFWSDDGTGEGSNWLGALLMLRRGLLLRQDGAADAWAVWVEQKVNLATGKVSPSWQGQVRKAREAVVAATAGRGLRSASVPRKALGYDSKPSPTSGYDQRGARAGYRSPSPRPKPSPSHERKNDFGTGLAGEALHRGTEDGVGQQHQDLGARSGEAQWWYDASEPGRSVGRRDWQKFDVRVNSQIEAAHAAGRDSVTYKVFSWSYKIDFANSKQMNLTTLQWRWVKREDACNRQNLQYSGQEFAGEGLSGRSVTPTQQVTTAPQASLSNPQVGKRVPQWSCDDIHNNRLLYDAKSNLAIEEAYQANKPTISITVPSGGRFRIDLRSMVQVNATDASKCRFVYRNGINPRGLSWRV